MSNPTQTALLQDWLTAISKAASFLRFRSTEVSVPVAEEYLRVSAALTDLECHLADIEPLLPRWVDVRERLPVIGQRVAVLVHDGEGLTAYTDYLAADRFWHAYVSDVQFWMPLPEPPKGTTR